MSSPWKAYAARVDRSGIDTAAALAALIQQRHWSHWYVKRMPPTDAVDDDDDDDDVDGDDVDDDDGDDV